MSICICIAKSVRRQTDENTELFYTWKALLLLVPRELASQSTLQKYYYY